jgi:hypothetical protein
MLLHCLVIVLVVVVVLGAAESPILANDMQAFQLPDGAFPHDVVPAPEGKVCTPPSGMAPSASSTPPQARAVR